MADSNDVDRGDNLAPTDEELGKKEEGSVVDLSDDDKKVAEEAAAKAAEEKKESEDKGKVPRERMKEAVDKERAKAEAAIARAAELEAKLAAHATSEDIGSAQKALKELYKQRNSHLADGKLDEAGAIDEKIFNLQEAIAERKAEIKVESAKVEAVESMKYDVVVERLEAEHPEINPDSDEFDEELATEIRALMRGYQQELKMSPSQALARAAKRVFGAQKKDEKAEEKKDEEGLRRKTEAVERNTEAAKKQPASTKDVGLDHDKKGGGLDAKTVMKMNYSEFSKLGEDVLAKLRGDTL